MVFLFSPGCTILMLTAYDDANVPQGLDLGANDFIRKPIDFEELLARIRVSLRLKHSLSSPKQCPFRGVKQQAVLTPCCKAHKGFFVAYTTLELGNNDGADLPSRAALPVNEERYY